ncbi:uncharacterized protein LOC120358497 [Solenopsis invicta]|uniref:uncharacterized protein LOC120358497 n=1 Tax=Solenopsis invicta TaxID=13686 RepID=UPI00193D869D|nr:uncharacterized protein LOC120358497 [Solenopsis invicta]
MLPYWICHLKFRNCNIKCDSKIFILVYNFTISNKINFRRNFCHFFGILSHCAAQSFRWSLLLQMTRAKSCSTERAVKMSGCKTEMKKVQKKEEKEKKSERDYDKELDKEIEEGMKEMEIHQE